MWTYDAADKLRREERDGPNAYDVTHTYDALGSTAILTDSVQVTTDDYTYDAYSKLGFSTGTTPNRYTWVGELGYGSKPIPARAVLRTAGRGRPAMFG